MPLEMLNCSEGLQQTGIHLSFNCETAGLVWQVAQIFEAHPQGVSVDHLKCLCQTYEDSKEVHNLLMARLLYFSYNETLLILTLVAC